MARASFRNPADVCNAMFLFMCEEYAFGIKEWNRETLANAVGYTNARTAKCLNGIKMLQKKGLAEKGKTKNTLSLSSKGISQMPAETKPTTLKEVHERFITMIEKKTGKKTKVRPTWEILKDRNEHTIDSVAKKLGYSNPTSFKNTKILQVMESMGLLTKDKQCVQMTDKPYPSNLTNEEVVEF